MSKLSRASVLIQLFFETIPQPPFIRANVRILPLIFIAYHRCQFGIIFLHSSDCSVAKLGAPFPFTQQGSYESIQLPRRSSI